MKRRDFLAAAGVEAQAVRIEIEATNGIDEARIFEVRCYG